MNIKNREGQEHRQLLAKLLQKAAHSQSMWCIWEDFIYMSAASLSQPFDFKQEREEEYVSIINRYDKSTQLLFPKMIREITLAFEQEGCYDILGEIYMELSLSDKWKGQFFTPFHVCSMIAKISADNAEQEITEKGFIIVEDPTCGSGAMLIAFAKHYQEQGINYQKDVLFVGQDIDPVVAKMCYIQMSLLGMAGYVIVGNTFTQECNEVWYTPMYFIYNFQCRKQRTVAENYDKDDKIYETTNEGEKI